MLTPKHYVEILQERGKSLSEIGVNGMALERDAALEAIEALKDSQSAILGGDVYRLVAGIPEHTYDNWYSQREDSESLEHYVRRSWGVAKRYIESYVDPEDGSILYSLVLSDYSA
jgi:Immunity protein 40